MAHRDDYLEQWAGDDGDMVDNFADLGREGVWGRNWALRGLAGAPEVTIEILQPEGWRYVGDGARTIRLQYNGTNRYEILLPEDQQSRV